MAGDFNELMVRVDKSGGTPRAFAPMALFRQTMEAASLSDMGFYGCHFTWFNKFTKERLDRSFMSASWKAIFPLSRTITLPPYDSDHNHLLIEARAERDPIHRHPRTFHFEEIWHGNSQCLNIIQKNWSTPLTGNMMKQLGSNIHSTGQQLLQWHATDFQRQKLELREVQSKLLDIMRQPYSVEQYEEQRRLHVKQSQLLSQEEKYWRQRSRAIWLKDGDRNSAYFHRKASNRKSRNTIRGLMNNDGVWTTDPQEIKQLLLNFYNMTFTSEGVNESAISKVF
ncbi:uncharacterized protein LOC133746177 [Rosa rugosa]|uniref:uncharacterized protein LOC133746177 n=1 Tax=Rosa rugosa TaxID=74645 RepID=UPI002B410E5E|nr:uncharacterized protein LOC133746177 [Rosa rugosa]